MGDELTGRPRLAVVYHPYSITPLKIAEAARAVCDLVWILDKTDPVLSQLVPLIRRLGPIVDTAGLEEDQIASSLAIHRPDGIITFADQMQLTAALAETLGLPFHSRQTALRLANKYQQRIALAASGIATPGFWPISFDATSDDIRKLAGEVRFPVVLKPQDGLGSRATHLVDDVEALLALVTQFGIERGGLLVEEVLPEAHPRRDQRFADVLMVESVLQGGSITHLTATGHFIPAEPFRGTGSFVPSHLDPLTVAEVYAATEAAAAALGIEEGFINTDLILTPAGARVLEVNGRVGGQIPELFELVDAQPVLPLAMELAIGHEEVAVHPLDTDRVAFCMTYQPPMDARWLTRLNGLDKVAKLPGVMNVVPNKRPGDGLDWREGTIGKLFTVYGTAPDHDALHVVHQLVHESLDVAYD